MNVWHIPYDSILIYNILFKKPGVPGKSEKILLKSSKPMTEILRFKLKQYFNDTE